MILYPLTLGFLIGIRHAFEADHLAAVAALATRAENLKEGLKLGSVWGMGHTLTLFVFGSMVLFLDTVVPERMAQALEMAVGVMLVVMGLSVFWRMVRERIHFHVHQHPDGISHAHFHSHLEETSSHNPENHHHSHARGLTLRALLVGMMHGMAGSAALVLLALNSISSIEMGILYIVLFGIGSTLGMALISLVIVIPLRWSSSALNWTHNGLKGLIGFATLGLGVWMALGF